MAIRTLEVLERETDLLEVVRALSAASRFSCSLYCGEQQRDQDADDGDDHEQLDEREAATMLRHDDHSKTWVELLLETVI